MQTAIILLDLLVHCFVYWIFNCFQAMSTSDHEMDDDPDGVYAFRRKPGVSYHAVRTSFRTCFIELL